MSEVCTHGNLKRQCETCAAWESAVHNQRRAEEAEARVKELEAQVVAEKACRDRTYEQLSKAHARLESLKLHFADELAYLEADEEKGGE